MIKSKVLSVILIVITLCGICFVFAGCPAKETTYVTRIKIVCREILDDGSYGPVLDEWIFIPDVNMLTTRRYYDGKRYMYYAKAYNMPDHPRWGDSWLVPDTIGPDAFYSSLAKKREQDNFYEDLHPDYVCDKGDYCLTVFTTSSSTMCKPRTIYLYINVW